MHPGEIPIHHFSVDDGSSIPFRFLPLELKTGYDTSVPHRHNYYEIFVFMAGGGMHQIDFNNFPILPHSLHFVSPGQVHHVMRDPGSYGYVILFSRDFYAAQMGNKDILFDHPYLNNNSGEYTLNFTRQEFDSVWPTIQSLEQETAAGGEYLEDMVRSLLNILLLKSTRKFSAQHPVSSQPVSSHLYKEFRILLEKNFVRLHKVKEYAELMNISEKTLNESIKKITGKTASEQIFERIILEAKRLLRHSKLSAKEIAYFLNYQDPAHFSKFFKQQTGHTPSEFSLRP